jgi:lysine 2,3-aminomutase
LRTAAELAEAGLAAPSEALEKITRQTSVAITPAVLDLIDPNRPDDPVARQFVPSIDELTIVPEERADPIGDDAFSPLPGLVHRYPDRVLIKPIMVCPVYCRFCFRRESVGDADGTLSPEQLDAAFAYVADRPGIREIILTGGDPLMLGAARLADLVRRADAVPHVEVLRLHTRVPVADPDRVDDTLAAALGGQVRVAVWVSIHVNHPHELSEKCANALKRLSNVGIPLVSQSVLLKGVNDSVDVLESLFRALIRHRVRPYYLHHPDLVRGTSHFRPTIAEGQSLMRALRGRLTGIAQPTYVLDIPGGAGKVPVGPSWVGEGEVEDVGGARHPYPVAHGDPTC